MRGTTHARLAAALVTLVALGALTLAADAPPKAATPKRPTPKPLGTEVTKGLAWLAAQQNPDGGWSQGGGWRTVEQGGRVEGKEVADPSDVGNTAMACLAMIRAGNTPTTGPYAKQLTKGVEFIRNRVEKSDAGSLWVTDVKGTQLQSKIGTYVDTFLSAMVLAEMKGKMPDADAEKRLVAALDKNIAKIEKNQGENGLIAGNAGWATVLSQGLCNKGLVLARQAGAKVSDRALDRAQQQVAVAAAQPAAPAGAGGVVSGFAPAASGPVVRGGARAADPKSIGAKRFAEAAGRPAAATTTPAKPAAGAAEAPSDAGVALYKQSAIVNNASGLTFANAGRKADAKKVLDDPKAPEPAKDEARKVLKTITDGEKLRDDAVREVAKNVQRPDFVAGFGSNGGEEFLSFLNISETMLVKGGEDWEKWDKKMHEGIGRVQDKDGSWSGQHCITGKTFCTSAALLVLMADRTPAPAEEPAPKK
jgi:hypothetical protein